MGEDRFASEFSTVGAKGPRGAASSSPKGKTTKTR